MNTEDNKQLLRRFENEAWNNHRPAILDELCAPDYRAHMPGGRTLDLTEHRQVMTFFQQAFPDCGVTTDELIAEGERVAWRWTFRGTQFGEFHSLPPTGRCVTMSGISMLRIGDGKLLESWHQGDNQSLVQQLTGEQPT